MDVEKPPLEQKISVGSGDAANADMTKGNNNKCNNCSQLSEKLNLDRSSGDESIMDDEPETKPTQSVTSHQVSEKNDLLPENPDIMDLGKGEAPDNKSPHPLVVSDKRKLPVNGKAFSFFSILSFCFTCLIPASMLACEAYIASVLIVVHLCFYVCFLYQV